MLTVAAVLVEQIELSHRGETTDQIGFVARLETEVSLDG